LNLCKYFIHIQNTYAHKIREEDGKRKKKRERGGEKSLERESKVERKNKNEERYPLAMSYRERWREE